MAEQAAHHVVNSTQSVGAATLTDVPGNNLATSLVGGEEGNALDNAQRDGISSSLSDTPTDSINFHNISKTSMHIDPDSPTKETGSLPNGMQTQVDGAVNGSDTDWRRRESSDVLDRMSSRDRSNSSKKPTSFKAVSVTKNFLAKSAGTSPSPKLVMDIKGSNATPIASPTLSMPKPRLVAKTGTNSRSATLSTTVSSGAPDPSKVWNRNRPVAPPPPKQFTDEELKQQYGIHLATRLQADEPGKGSTWADMEDDEDDWAPDTVEWMDGTKSTLQPSEEQRHAAATVEHPPSPDAKPEDTIDRPVANVDDGMHGDGPPAPGKTILRPGIRATMTQTRPGLVLRNVPEPAVESPFQSTPGLSKSPWAKLPPVDKVSPVSFSPVARMPAEGKPPPVSYRDYQPPPQSGPSPTREIAADTFERSWRDGDRGSRELFDSKSGRYEPVREKRRSSFRGEGSFRPPSVLQRPSQGRPSDATEPQPRDRMMLTQDVRQWERRRSSVAIDDDADSRKEPSQHSPLSAKASLSDHAPSVLGAPQAYAAHGPDTPQPNGQPQSGPGSNVHELQQQLMRQKIEANRKRKEEEQAKEDAERKERIRQKLLALGEPQKQQESPGSEPLTAPSGQVMSEKSLSTLKPVESHEPRSNADSAFRAPLPASLEPTTHLDGLGEVPTSFGKNAGSITPSEAAVKHHVDNEPLNTPQPPHARLPTSPSQPKQSSDPSDVPSMAVTPPKMFSEQRNFERSQQQWGRANSSLASAQGWNANASNTANKATANVWGPPSSDKSLGNGAFESDIGRISTLGFTPQNPSQTGQPPPGPIAPPSVPPKVNVPPGRDIDHSPPNVRGQQRMEWQAQPPGLPHRAAYASTPGPRPPQAFFGSGQSQAQWNTYGRERSLQDDRHVPGEPSPNLTRQRPVSGEPMADRWMPDRRRTTNVASGADILTPSLTPSILGQSPSQQMPHAILPNMGTAVPSRMGSRFFGAVAERPQPSPGATSAPHFDGVPAIAESQTGGSDLDLFGQEVLYSNDGRAGPLVRLPRPRPKVRLPVLRSPRPAELPKVEAPPSPFAGRPTGFGSPSASILQMRPQPVRFGQQPIVANAEWQNRFDMVTGRKSSAAAPQQDNQGPASPPARPQPVGVNTSSRQFIDMGSASSAATVSLPQKTRAKDPALYSLSSHLAVTKPECIFAEPDHGSRPTVLLPKSSPSLTWGATAVHGYTKLASARSLPVQAWTSMSHTMEASAKIQIHLPGRGALSRPFSKKISPVRPQKGPRKVLNKKDRVFEKTENKPLTINGVTGQGDVRDERPRGLRTKKNVWAKPPRGTNGTTKAASAIRT